MPISPIADIIADLRQGRMVIIMDDADRENEGDLLMIAGHVHAADINFMARYGRGLICLTLTAERCRQLKLPLMVSENNAHYATQFMVSIEAASGVTTGISAADRATTIKAAVNPAAKPEDIVQPGHIFPIMAKRGGVLARAGHTEAGVDLARLAGMEPASVICEILREDGSMARLPDLEIFAQQHQLKIGTIADLIRYRTENEATVQRIVETHLATEFGEFRVVVYHDDIEDKAHLALIMGKIVPETPISVRVHVQTGLWGLLGEALRADTWNLRAALAYVAREGNGVVVVLNQSEPSAEMVKRIQVFKEKDSDVEIAQSGDKDELRTYGLGGQILADLGVRKMRVLSHPRKAPGLSGFGLEITEYISPDAEFNKDKKRAR